MKHIQYKFKNIAQLLLAGVTLLGCTKVIDFEESEITPMLVVNCVMTVGEPIVVDLTSTQPSNVSTIMYEAIQGAQITITDGENTSTSFDFVSHTSTDSRKNKYGDYETFKYETGTYVNDEFIAEANKTYTLTFYKDGFKEVTSTTTTPKSVPFEIKEAYNEDSIRIAFNDNASEKNYYRLEASLAYLAIKYDTVLNQIDSLIIGKAINGAYPSHPKIYNYEQTASSYFFEPFGNYSVLIVDDKFNGETIEPALYVHLQLDPQEYTYIFDESGFGHQTEIKKDYIFYKFIVLKPKVKCYSESYYNYTISRQSQYESFQDGFTEPVIAYSNIENGVGFFAAIAQTSDYVVLPYNNEMFKSYLPQGLGAKEMYEEIERQYLKLFDIE